MEVNRGDVVLVAAKGDFAGKPRLAVVIQSDLFNPTHDSITVCPTTLKLHDAPMFRLGVEPTRTNGLRKLSQVMVDKIFSARRSNLGGKVGRLDKESMRQVDAAIRLWVQV
jgi:mRNA interferase MazF